MGTQLVVRGVTVGIPLLILIILRFLWKLPRNAKWAKGIPVFGMLVRVWHSLQEYTIHDDFAEMHKKLGKTFAYHVLGQPFVATIDPAVIEHFLKTNFNNYIKGHIFRDNFTELLGDGIFNVDGILWTHQRKISSKMFTKKSFETHIFHAVTNNTKKVQEVMNHHHAKNEKFCLFDLMNRYTLDTIGEIGFSKNIGSLDNPSSPFLKSFDFAQQGMLKRFWTGQGMPWWRILKLFGLLWEAQLPAHFRTLNEYCEKIVDDLVEKVSKGDDNSFVGLFIKDPEGAQMMKTDGHKFRIFIRDMVLNFLIAGRDTTAQCLTWTVFELAQAPEVVAKAREEIARVCGEAPITYADLSNMRYIKAILDEGLRLHPSVPMDGKLTVEADTLPNGVKIAAGTILQYNAYSQGRCEALWGPDASAFRPERWLERATYPSSFEFSAFHAGPRECLGRRLAVVEMTTFIATFLRAYDFSLCVPPADVKYDTQLTLGCSSGCPFKAVPRNSC